MKKHLMTLMFCSGLLAGCDTGYQLAQQVNTAPLANKSSDENINLATIMAQLFEAQLALNPLEAVFIDDFRFNAQFVDNLSDDYLKQRHELNQRYLALANSIDRAKLTPSSQLSFDSLNYDLQMALQGETYPEHFLPFNQFNSLINTMAQLGSGRSAQPFNTVENYQQFAQRLEGYVKWFASAQSRLSQGMANNVVLPRVLTLRILPQLKAQLVTDIKDSVFYQPLMMFPASFTAEQQQTIIKQYNELLTQRLLPAYQGLYDFINDQYLAKTRSTPGYSGLPNGRGWYQFKANQHTTSEVPAEQIHQVGLAEVKRITLAMDKVRQEIGFSGNLAQFFEYLSKQPQYYFTDSEQLLQAYDQIKQRIDQVLPQFFITIPANGYVIKPVEYFREHSAAGASYAAGSVDGSRPGTFYINTSNLKAQPKWAMMTQALHETVPGHHLQISHRQDLTELPKLRRFSRYSAYSEGWALYSEQLGLEMGLLDDPYQRFGQLSAEMLRAMRLVVDTGLHIKGWTREQAIVYMLNHSAMTRSTVVGEVERYMALPGQALAYKMGQLKIVELRALAQAQLGDKFELKQFHQQILSDGELPLAILTQKIHAWISEVKQRNEPEAH